MFLQSSGASANFSTAPQIVPIKCPVFHGSAIRLHCQTNKKPDIATQKKRKYLATASPPLQPGVAFFIFPFFFNFLPIFDFFFVFISMKKILKKTAAIFICFLSVAFLNAKSEKGFLPFKHLNLSSSTAFTIPKKSSGNEKAVSANAGAQLVLENLELRAYGGLTKTEFSEIQACENFRQRFELLENLRYGGAISLYSDSTPLVFKFGMNSFSRSISRLKNPAPSATANPLKKNFSFSSGIGISLPTLNSSEKPKSTAVSLNLPFSKNFEMDFQSFLSEDDSAGLSAQWKIRLSRIALLDFSSTLGRFYIENNSSVLQKNYCSFDPAWFYAGCFESSLKTPFLKTNFYTGIHENPLKNNEYENFPSFSVWIKTENRFAFKNFLLDFSYFAIPTSKNSPRAAPLIGGSSSICRTIEQWTFNPQFLLQFSDKNISSLRLGASAVTSWKITSSSLAEEYEIIKLSSGILFENKFISTKGEYSIANLILGNEPSSKSSIPEKFQEGKISFSARNKLFSISATSSCKFYFEDFQNNLFAQSKKQKYSFNLAISPKNKIAAASSSLTLNRENEKNSSGTFSSNCTVKFKSKKIMSSCKIGISVPF